MNPEPDELDQLMAVMAVAFDPAYGEAWSRRQVEDALLIGSCGYGLISVSGAEPAPGETAIGFYLARHGYQEDELLLLAVDPTARRKGLGARLLEQFVSAARARGSQRLCLEMRRGNPAERLYCRYGFRAVGERKDYYRHASGGRIDAITFVCELTA